MEEIENSVEKISAAIKARCGCQVDNRVLNDGGYHLYNPMLFAGIWRQPTKRRFKIQVKEEYAIKSGIAELADKRDDKGWFGKPAHNYYVIEADSRSYNKSVEALSKICQVY